MRKCCWSTTTDIRLSVVVVVDDDFCVLCVCLSRELCIHFCYQRFGVLCIIILFLISVHSRFLFFFVFCNLFLFLCGLRLRDD